MSHAATVTEQRSSIGLVEHLFEKLGLFVLVTGVFAYGLAMIFVVGPP